MNIDANVKPSASRPGLQSSNLTYAGTQEFLQELPETLNQESVIFVEDFIPILMQTLNHPQVGSE